jgi:hypothetical protein
MATLLLSAAGAAVGGLFGPVGAILGRAAGAFAGYALDQSLFGEKQRSEGARLSDVELQASREGAAIPRVYGRVRIAGQVIWATRFEEVVSETETDVGGKGGGSAGTTVKSYSYFANFAVGLCEGPVAAVGRVWADGRPLDLAGVTFRLHRGTAAQMPDSLIEAKQGEGKAPAYRGTAYVVFEHLPLEKFGNRIPNLTFEVLRPVGTLEAKVRAVTLIPGATEHGYDPNPVREVIGPGKRRLLNRHVDTDTTDWRAAVDELNALCPNLESVALVVTWYGNDLRASHCTLKPAVVSRNRTTVPDPWAVAGLTRADARLVSTYQGAPAFGGTPSDQSVVRAIRNLKARGLKVMLYPFIMMDIAAGNGRPDPYGGAEQAAYPWRGSLTLSLAPGMPGSPDKTAAAASEVAGFVGTAAPGDFALDGDDVVYSGPAEWSYRRFVLHTAKLAKAAGGVDAFLVGSELRGLTRIRSSASAYPFVDALVDLAGDVRTILGAAAKISYAADWSEYAGHRPDDGTGDVRFHLDPLWAADAIDFVGIDNYMPLADWRDGGDHLDAALFENGRSAAYFRANVAAGEGYDWYYASDADRAAQVRTPIADGVYGKPWVFRVKDLAGWWGNLHFDRPGGVESGTPTAWVPQSKPIWFTELGCPAVDKGANQPNVFPDPKSSASARPYFSSGRRDDLLQRRFLDAATSFFDPADPDFVEGSNPVSAIYGGRMVDVGRTHLWTWDARPFPAFPAKAAIWSDGPNHATGHWLTGRLGAAPADGLVAKILADYGIADIAVEELDGVIDGYVVGSLSSARTALEPLAALLMFEARESGDTLRFVRRAGRAGTAIAADDLAEDSDRPLLQIRRAQETELPAEIALGFADLYGRFQATTASTRRLLTGSRRLEARDTGVVMSRAAAAGFADAMLQDLWAGRETYAFAVAGSALGLEPADICDLATPAGTKSILLTRIEDGLVRRIEARSIEPAILSAEVPEDDDIADSEAGPELSAPAIAILDLPLLSGSEVAYRPRIAAFADPWPGAVAVSVGTAATGFAARQALTRRATMGELAEALGEGPVGRLDRANTITVKLHGGALASAAPLAVLNGSNLAAIGSEADGWEVVQFETAEMLDAETWRLSGLLRGQGGTADRCEAGHAAGARFVLLNAAVESLALTEAEAGLALTARCGPAGAVYDPDVFVDVAVAAARRGLVCLRSVHARGTRGAGGEVTIAFIRQTRVGGDAWEPAEVPLGEAAEAYLIDILDGATVKRTLSAASPAAVYAAADQVADFGALPATLHVRISQVSPTEGPGLAAESVLHV